MNSIEAEQFVTALINERFPENEAEKMLIEMAHRGETPEEIAGAVRALRKQASILPDLAKLSLLDTCGTGGSGLPRMNISTLVAFVLSALDVPVAKHGNKAASGRCGSFDLLEALGIRFTQNAAAIRSSLARTNLAFLFAPFFHPLLKKIAPLRKKIGRRTIFNLVGPLLNPASPRYQLIGAPTKGIAKKIAHAALALGLSNVTVVSGEDGLDEVTVCGVTYVFEVKNGQYASYIFDPACIGIPRVPSFGDIAGGTIAENTAAFMELIEGRGRALQNLLEVNCVFAMRAARHENSLAAALKKIRFALKSGAVRRHFEFYKQTTL